MTGEETVVGMANYMTNLGNWLGLDFLAPNGRPQQVTHDLWSFWENTYPQVKKELQGRYPKHAWPQDPWSATPERRPGKRRSTD